MVSSFQNLLGYSSLIEHLREKSILKPWPIQSAAIPHIAKFRDVVVRAKAGSGKTTAYLISLLDEFEVEPGRRIPEGIIIVPTFKFGEQVLAELVSMIETGLPQPKVSLLEFPTSFPELAALLREPPDIIVSTPDCLLSCLKERYLETDTPSGSLSYLVIDDIDLLSPNGFEDLQSLMDHIPKSCKRVLVSGDPSCDVENLKPFLKDNPYIITLPEQGDPKVEMKPYNAEQSYVSCDARDKLAHMFLFLYSWGSNKKVLIFTNSSHESSRLRLYIDHERSLRLESAVLDAGLPDNSRLQILENFDAGLVDCLIVTDGNELKRKFESEFGLFRPTDLKNLDCVLHYDMPKTASEYARRLEIVGRHKIVRSTSLISPEEMEIIEEIKSSFGEDGSQDPKIFVPCIEIGDRFNVERYQDLIEGIEFVMEESNHGIREERASL